MEKLDKFIRGNFLLIIIVMAVAFAFFKKATIWQQVVKTKTITTDTPLLKIDSSKISK